MLEPILSPDELWPGGIPSSIRLHADASLSERDDIDWTEDDYPYSADEEDADLSEDAFVREESKGWCQFVHEEWVPKTDLNEEMQQRRALIERWASADQAFRDSYHDRAPLRESPLDYPPNLLSKAPGKKRFVCLAPVDKEHHVDNYIRLVKVVILLYFHEDSTGRHPMSHFNDDNPQVPGIIVDPSSATPDLSSINSYRNLLSSYYLQPADFRVVSMTRAGRVIFPHIWWEDFTVIDQKSLNDGRVVLMNFKYDGQVKTRARLLPQSMAIVMMYRHVLGHHLEEHIGRHGSHGHPRWNGPIDISQPMIAILDALTRRNIWKSPSQYPPDYWAREVDYFAPGYLELEAEDREADYDLNNLTNYDDLINFYPPPEQREDQFNDLIKAGVLKTHGDETRQCSLGKYRDL